MGFFGGKSPHQQNLESLLKLTLGVFRFSSEGKADDTVRFLRPDSGFRLLFFSLCTAHVAGAPRMRNPDAVLNDAMHKLVRLAFVPEPLPGDTVPANKRFAGPKVPQEAANLAAECVEDFLHRYSSWVDIHSSGDASAGTGVIAGMLRDVETGTPVTQDDDIARLMSLAYGIEAMIPPMRAAFK